MPIWLSIPSLAGRGNPVTVKVLEICLLGTKHHPSGTSSRLKETPTNYLRLLSEPDLLWLEEKEVKQWKWKAAMFLAVPPHVWKVQDLHSYTVFLNTKQNVQFHQSLYKSHWIWKILSGPVSTICSIHFFHCFFCFNREKLPATERDLKENYDRQESRAPRLV